MDTAPMMVGGSTLILRSRSIVVDTAAWGWVWNGPIAVLVQGPNGTYQHRIVDITALAQAAAIGIVVLSATMLRRKHVCSRFRKAR